MSTHEQEVALTPPPHKYHETRCNSKSPYEPGARGFDTCWGRDGHREQMHTSASRRWSDPPEVEALAKVIESAWGQPGLDGRTLRPIDRRLARAILQAGYALEPEGRES